MAMSRAERLKRKREAERRRQKKIFEDPERLAEVNEKRRARYHKRKNDQKGKKE